MMDEKEKLEAVKRLLNQKYLEWQQKKQERKTITEFAEYLGFPEIIKAIQNVNKLTFKTPAQNQDLITKQITDLRKKEKRLLDLYEDEIIDKPTLNTRLEDIRTRLTRAQTELATQEQATTRQRHLLTDLQAIQKTITTLPTYIRQAPPSQVNATLHRLFSKIQITKKHEIHVYWQV